MGEVMSGGSGEGAGPVVMAVDGGGSKTDVIAIDLDGAVVAHARGTGTNPQSRGWAVAGPHLDEVRSRVLAEIGHRPILTTHVYLAGLDFEEEITAARAALAHWADDGGAPDVLDNDLFALLRAGTLAPNAVAVVCGTGINAIGIRADGATARFPAIGDISGDWGGGAFLGNRALWHAARAEDGRGPETALRKAVADAFGLPDVHSVTKAFHFGDIPGNAINRLSPVLFTVADAGDVVARSVISRQAEEIVLLTVAAMRRLGLTAGSGADAGAGAGAAAGVAAGAAAGAREDWRVPVVLGGGVLAASHPLLTDEITARLADAVPNAVPTWVKEPPILGAGLSALESVGASAAALDRYRMEVPGGVAGAPLRSTAGGAVGAAVPLTSGA